MEREGVYIKNFQRLRLEFYFYHKDVLVVITLISGQQDVPRCFSFIGSWKVTSITQNPLRPITFHRHSSISGSTLTEVLELAGHFISAAGLIQRSCVILNSEKKLNFFFNFSFNHSSDIIFIMVSSLVSRVCNKKQQFISFSHHFCLTINFTLAVRRRA